MKKRIILLLMFIFIPFSVSADSDNNISLDEQVQTIVESQGIENKSDINQWSFETSLTFPLHQIYMAQFGYKIVPKSEFLIGPCFQNWKDEVEAKGRAHAYTLLLGYRQYIWKNLHGEIELFPAYNSFRSSVNNKVYNGFELWVEYMIGWKLNFKIKNIPLYIIPQPAIGHAVYLQNIWPGLSESTFRQNSIMFVPQLIIGINI